MSDFEQFRRGQHVYTRFGKARSVQHNKKQLRKTASLSFEQADNCSEVYSNVGIVDVHETQKHFVLKFGKHMPGLSAPFLKSTIIMEPHDAYGLYQALKANIQKWDDDYNG